MIFTPLKSVRPDRGDSAAAYSLLRMGVAVISAHTNADAAPRGVSWAAGRRVGGRDCHHRVPPLGGLDRADPLRDPLGKPAHRVRGQHGAAGLDRLAARHAHIDHQGQAAASQRQNRVVHVGSQRDFRAGLRSGRSEEHTSELQ